MEDETATFRPLVCVWLRLDHPPSKYVSRPRITTRPYHYVRMGLGLFTMPPCFFEAVSCLHVVQNDTTYGVL